MDTSQPIQRKRQTWPLTEKRRIVKATLAPGASVAQIARASGVNANQVFTWRRLYRQGKLGQTPGTSLLPVRMATESSFEPSSIGSVAAHKGVIQIETAKLRLQIEPGADEHLLRWILASVLR